MHFEFARLRFAGVFIGVWLLSAALAFAQTEANVSGTVSDPSGAKVVGAIVTALNASTGVNTTIPTNDAGVYTMPSLPPGNYKFTAEHPGFRKGVIDDVVLQTGTVLVLNMGLELGQTTETVEVQAVATAVNATSASVGSVVDGKRLLDLPLTGRSAYNLLLTQPGVQLGTNYYLNGNQGTSVNFTMDGVTAMDNLHNSAFYLYSNVVSVDRAEEFRVVTSAADAEYGRGSGQVQMVSRAGTNRFQGSVYYEVRNKSLNANDFFNNLQGTPRSQLKENRYGVRWGGPLKKNRTFFNGIYEPYKTRNFTTRNSLVYTASARNGDFRFYPGVQNQNFAQANPAVDLGGNPIVPAGATGPLNTVRVLGRDPNKSVVDPTGAMAHVLGYMPLPNNFRFGDGLNTAAYTWNQPTPVNFELYEGRIDHLFNDKHRIAITLSQQSYHSYNVASPPPFPDVPGNSDPTETTTYSAALTSILRPNLLNDARVGVFRYRTIVQAPYEPNQPGATADQRKNYLSLVGGVPAVVNPTANVTTPYTPAGLGGFPGSFLDPSYQWSDTLTWIKGRHSFKGGFTARFITLSGFDFGRGPVPLISVGGPPLQPVTNISTGTNPIPNIGLNATAATNLLYDLTGSVLAAQQVNLSPGGENPVFLPGLLPYRAWHQNEYSWFFKDDFKVSPSLTLNLGVRWELYQVPTEAQGKMLAPIGDGGSVFGISGNTFGALFNPTAAAGSQTLIQAIGAGTANPNRTLYNGDLNNFAPAVGLAWNVPGDGFWKVLSGGKDRMTVRIGYGIGYSRLPIGVVNSASGAEPGYSEIDTSLTATNLSNQKLPVLPTGVPLAPVPLVGTGSHTQTLYAYDRGLRTPYIQNYNFTITRALTDTMTLNVAYVGSKSSKLVRSVNTNEVNIFENGLLQAFNTVQGGGSSALIDQIFSNSYAAVAAAGGGSNYVRTNSATQGFFANNNPGGFANYISTTNALSGVVGGLLSNAKLPLNSIVANPQFLNTFLIGNFSNATYNSLQVEVNKRFSHSFTLQSSYVWSHNLGDTEGDVSGSTVQGGVADSYRTLRNMSLDKRPLSFDYASVFKINGLYELPFGRGKMLGRNAPGWVDRIIGNWQIGAIGLFYSGRPLNFTAQNTINTIAATTSSAAFSAMPVGALPGNAVQKVGNGVVYFNGLKQVTDPSVAYLGTSALRSLSTLKAITDASGNLLLVNPLSGQLGPLAGGILRGPGAKTLNLNVIKRIKVTERITLQLGATADNVTNTPVFADPTTDINNINFGRITSTGGLTPFRVVVLQGRVNF
ncbi:MAG: carboxypeptidase regulatory-like domain-containing protein [Acidobacteriia bacterium]|nr:carboxypeptidase regulatory-like domain-containing protein [Terriglobia bacterium]